MTPLTFLDSPWPAKPLFFFLFSFAAIGHFSWGRFRVRGLDPVHVRVCGESAAAFALASHSLRECSIPLDEIHLRIVELLKPGHARKCLLVGKWFSLGIWLTAQNLFSRVSCYVSGTVQAKNNL